MCVVQVGGLVIILALLTARLACRWHTHPGLASSARRLLHVKGAANNVASSLSSMSHQAACQTGSGSGREPSESSQLQWSKPFDAMSCAFTLATVATSPGVQAHVAVSASQVCLPNISPPILSPQQVGSVSIFAAQETLIHFIVCRASHGHVRHVC